MRNLLILLVVVIAMASCSKDDEPKEIIKKKSTLARLSAFSVKVNGSVYPLYANDKDMSSLTFLPPNASTVEVEGIQLSNGASVNVDTGDVLTIDQFPLDLVVTAEDEETTKIYTLSFQVATDTFLVHKHGLLKTKGNKIVNKHDEVVSFAGNSFFWSNDGWGSEAFYNAEVVKWLKDEWNTTIVRAALGVDESGGYVENPEANRARIITLIEAAIREGIYVIIDWHSHHAEDYSTYTSTFFSEMSKTYGKYENIIYEVYNEPLDVSWSNVLKPYAKNAIATIRSNHSPNLIVAGTPVWSQRVDDASADPITEYDNIAYTLHFYTVHHQKWLRDVADIALRRNVAIVVTEWGSLGYTQDDPEALLWMDWCRENDINHCNWETRFKPKRRLDGR